MARRAANARVEDHSVIHFADARLISLPNASYIELGKPEVKGKKLQCSFCPKITTHEHEFNGRVKFDPKNEKYFVSFVTTQDPERRVKPTLQIIPVTAGEGGALKGANRLGAKESRRTGPLTAAKILPILSMSQDETLAVFKSWLFRVVLQPNIRDSQIMAVTDVASKELILLKVEARASTTDSRSLLISNRRPEEALDSCKTCKQGSFNTVEDLGGHFTEVHGMSIKVKRIATKDKEEESDASSLEKPTLSRSETYVCHVCDETFAEDGTKINHINEVHAFKGECDYQCNRCLQSFKSRLVFRQHVRAHKRDKVRKYTCQLCSKSFLKVQHLQAHQQIHLGSKPFQCQLCDKKYSTSFSLKSHMVNTHGTGTKPKCEQCQKTFYNQSQLNKHVLQRHKRDERLSCSFCGQYYLRKDNLEAHIKSQHPSTDAAGAGKDASSSSATTCKICLRRYKSKDTLSEHLRSCHGILPWNSISDDSASHLKCKICEHTFLPAEMESHLRFSHGVMPIRPGTAGGDFSISEAAEALLRTLTPQPDYLLRCLTPLPMETLDDFITQQ